MPTEYEPNKLGGNHICTNTVNNILSVPLDECVDSYTWSIIPSGDQIAYIESPFSSRVSVHILTPGKYTVLLVTKNALGQRNEVLN